MAIKIHTADGHHGLKDYLTSLPSEFSNRGQPLRFIRNQLRTDEVNGIKFVIKSYKRIYWPNILRYSLTRSKASKAFHNALYLIEHGINTPAPLGYVEVRSFRLITSSYFLSEYTTLSPINEFMCTTRRDLETFIKCLAQFIFGIHEAHVYHKDFSTSNILFAKTSDGYTFSVIDNNRMRFGKLKLSRRIRNLERLDLPVDLLSMLAKEYALLCGKNEVYLAKTLFTYRWHHMSRGKVKSFGKRILKSLTEWGAHTRARA